MTEFIPVRTEDAEVFLKVCDIQRISFAKDDKLAQSERAAKVVFSDGTTGSYIAHRNVAKTFWSMVPKAE